MTKFERNHYIIYRYGEIVAEVFESYNCNQLRNPTYGIKTPDDKGPYFRESSKWEYDKYLKEAGAEGHYMEYYHYGCDSGYANPSPSEWWGRIPKSALRSFYPEIFKS